MIVEHAIWVESVWFDLNHSNLIHDQIQFVHVVHTILYLNLIKLEDLNQE